MQSNQSQSEVKRRASSSKKLKLSLAFSLPFISVLLVLNNTPTPQLSRTVDLSLEPVVETTTQVEATTQKAASSQVEPLLQVTTEQPPSFDYVVKQGDSLSQIFDRLGFPYSDMMSVMETDSDYLVLDTIRPGDKLRFWQLEQANGLQRLEVIRSLAEKSNYRRMQDGSYEYEMVVVPSNWNQVALVGEINGSFSGSANKMGLGPRDIDQVVTLLKDKLNFARDLRAGDRFEVVTSKQSVDGVDTGASEIQAIKIFNRGKLYSAYLHSNGQYYDASGESLQRAFIRYPVKNNRITSSFNPNRKHPVTGRVAPHNGTDFGVSTGTNVYTTGDGVVSMVRNHPYAGKYVVVDHGGPYKTRYLHLSKILVRKGQKVTRGQRIGLSGATGRVTGPHLHYELIVRGRPVNAMRANIPMADSVPKSELKQFIARRDELDNLIKQQETKLASL
ncbi:peptidoglycan DD-metalloendopeptidase family protein [Vibrio hippocampi]|uniref:peptidoglycan DD-metalloendopeptidase family protein n=1 Tax=Vibrio hippocampi TaxID=654686 RepID=UPI0025B720EC|nr:peptidoglycan DD-metalloendopeptidase family protein [Vibrio hippocampi]